MACISSYLTKPLEWQVSFSAGSAMLYLYGLSFILFVPCVAIAIVLGIVVDAFAETREQHRHHVKDM